MERADIEDIANRVAQTTVALARAENKLDLSEFKADVYARLDQRLDAMQSLVQSRFDHGIAGMSHEAHAVEHIQFRKFIEDADDIKSGFVKNFISILAAAIVSFLLTVYFSREGAIPMPVPKDIGAILHKGHGIEIV